MRVDLIRHGACLDTCFFRGQTPSQLSEMGQQQMQMAFSGIPCPEWVISSTAQRCAGATQAYYANHKAMPTIWYRDALQERYFGVWDGLSHNAVKALDAEGLEEYFDHPFEYAISEAESFEAFKQRVMSVFDELLLQAEQQGVEHVVLVTHGGVMRVLLMHIFALRHEALFQFEIGFGSRMTLECFSSGEPQGQGGEKFFIKLVELIQSPLDSLSG